MQYTLCERTYIDSYTLFVQQYPRKLMAQPSKIKPSYLWCLSKLIKINSFGNYNSTLWQRNEWNSMPEKMIWYFLYTAALIMPNRFTYRQRFINDEWERIHTLAQCSCKFSGKFFLRFDRLQPLTEQAK